MRHLCKEPKVRASFAVAELVKNLTTESLNSDAIKIQPYVPRNLKN